MKAECPLRFDVRMMTQDEREDLIQQFMCDKDIAAIASREPAVSGEEEDAQEDF